MAMWFLTLGCHTADTDPEADRSVIGVDHHYVALDIREKISAGGVHRATLLGDTAYVEDSGLTAIVNVNLIMYGESGRESGSLAAKYAEVGVGTRVVAHETVVLTTAGGQWLETEELRYDPEQDSVWSDVTTAFYEGGRVRCGAGFSSDANLLTIRLRDQSDERTRC